MTTLRMLAAILIALSGLAAAQEPPKPAAGAETKAPAKPPADAKATVLQIEKSDKPPECRDQAGDDRRRAARLRRADSQVTEPLERDTTVLFAHVLGDAPAVTALKTCVEHLRKAAEDCGARVIDSGSER